MEGVTLVWWEAKTKEEIKKHGNINLSCADFITTIKKNLSIHSCSEIHNELEKIY